MGAIPVVKGVALRATKIDSCGKPIEGLANRLVTTGFISAKLTPETNAAEELEQKNAEGKVCFSDRTPPEIKRYNAELVLCGVDPDLYSLFAGWERILDYDDTPIGVADQPNADSDYGVALEIWTGGRSDDDCPPPTTDAEMFSLQGSGKMHGYLLFGSTEWIPGGDFTVEAGVANFTLSGITIPIFRWGRGPYNVARINANGDGGRLLSPVGKKRHLTFFRTPIAPPEPTDGAVPLAIQSIFTAPNFYFGGAGNAPAADVAPEQPQAGDGYALTITGTPTGGTFSLNILYPGGEDEETGALPFNVGFAAAKTALVAPDDSYDASDWTVTGGSLPGGTITIVPPEGVIVEVADNNLTGGSVPTVHVDPV